MSEQEGKNLPYTAEREAGWDNYMFGGSTDGNGDMHEVVEVSYEHVHKFDWNRRMWESMQELARDIGATVIGDIGCGRGDRIGVICEMFTSGSITPQTVYAVDGSAKALRFYAKNAEQLPGVRVETIRADINKTGYLPENAGGAVIASQIDPYLDVRGRVNMAREAYNFLQSGGYMIWSGWFKGFSVGRIMVANWFEGLRNEIHMMTRYRTYQKHAASSITEIGELSDYQPRQMVIQTYQEIGFRKVDERYIWVDRGFRPLQRKGDILGSVILWQKP